MIYKELAPSDKAPFPFPRDEHGAYAIGAYPQGVLSFDQEMQAYYIKVLAAAKKVDAGATISDDVGMVVVTMPDGKSLMLTGGLYTQYASGAATPEKQLARSGIAPPAPAKPPNVDPAPAVDVPFLDTDGRWYKLSGPFLFKVACPPPAGTPTVDTGTAIKTKTIAYIKDELESQPPKSQETVDALIGVATFVAGLKG